MRTGVDVSRYQHPAGAPIDYRRAVGAGVDFAIVEYCDVAGEANPYFAADVEGFAGAGAGVAFYVFLRPEMGVEHQVAVLLDVAGMDLRSGGLARPVWGDLEVADGRDAAEVHAFWSALRERLPTVGLASNPAFIDWALIGTADRAPLWLDEWGVQAPSLPCVLWGMTDHAEVPGIPAPVDLDAFVGSDNEWADLFGSPPAPASAAARFVAGESMPTGQGYWLVDEHGRVLAFGDAAWHGSPAALNAPVVSIASTPSGRGYRLFAADGGVFDYGDARFRGSAV